MGNASGNLLPGGGFLCAEQFREVVEHDHIAGVGAARAEGTDRDGGVQDAPAGDNFQFAGDNTGALRPAHEIADGTSVFGADEFFEGASVPGGTAENLADGGIDPDDIALGIERKSAGREVFQNVLEELAATFEFAHRLREIARELIDVRA